jgi:branched-chain amino acid transport system ATP-binding protein
MALLEVDSVVAGYGGIMAIRGISLEVEDGEVVALIGSNGAGKSTTLRTITGLVRRRAGAIRFQGADIGRMAPHEVVAAGISLVPEGRGIFHRLTVMENLSMGAFRRARGSDLNDDYENVFTIFPRLKERARQPGGTLSGGEQQMLAIGRALMARPRLLLLDEPSMGLSPILTDIIFETIQDINKRLKTTILLVEQNAYMALAVTSRGYVLESGQIALHASSEDLMADPQVRGAYLGEV